MIRLIGLSRWCAVAITRRELSSITMEIFEMSKHTPGPWILETVRTQSGLCHKVGPFPAKREDLPSRHACLYADYPSSCNPADQELEANARLIAAAPELLEALEASLDYIERHTYGGTDGLALIDKTRAAIAKAKGESA